MKYTIVFENGLEIEVSTAEGAYNVIDKMVDKRNEYISIYEDYVFVYKTSVKVTYKFDDNDIDMMTYVKKKLIEGITNECYYNICHWLDYKI